MKLYITIIKLYEIVFPFLSKYRANYLTIVCSYAHLDT